MSIAVLISGRGSNLRAILDAGLPVSLVVSNRRDAPGLQHAEARKIQTAIVADTDYPTRAEADKQLAMRLLEASPEVVALAGFMRVLGAEIVREFRGRMVNIHPSLLPNFKGLDTHRRALEAGVKEHGCTVHWVSEGVDEGDIIRQEKVPIYSEDNEESLAARVLVEEHRLYPNILKKLITKRTPNIDAASKAGKINGGNNPSKANKNMSDIRTNGDSVFPRAYSLHAAFGGDQLKPQRGVPFIAQGKREE